MSVVVQLSLHDDEAMSSLWQAATDQRRRELGLGPLPKAGGALRRPGAFAVGVTDGGQLLAMALTLPGLGDDARSTHNVPGLGHISSVATRPGHWGRGLARVALRAAMLQATRRGFARVQLWTHERNVRAQRLYESEGFVDSGRRMLDQFGERVRHYVRELPAPPIVSRPAARLICLDPADRILLMHWRDPADGYRLWEPPGGGIEPGETPRIAVEREWVEETGLPVPHIGEASTLVARDAFFNGARLLGDEQFFLGRAVNAGVPSTDGATEFERESYLGHQWVAWDALEALDDPAEPDLVPILQRLGRGPWTR